MPISPERRRQLVVVAAGFSLVLTCVLLETISLLLNHLGYVHVAPLEDSQDDPIGPQRFDPELGWALRPGFYPEDEKTLVNRMGFRSSTEFDFSAPRSGKRRALLLGDSMIFGLGVPQEFIASEVINRESPRWEAVNTGVIAYSTAQEYVIQKKYSPLMKPDAAVLFFTEINDLWWNSRTSGPSAGFSIEGDKLIYHAPRRDNHVPLYLRTTFGRLVDQTLLQGKDFTFLKDRLSFELWPERSRVWVVTRRLLIEMKKVADEHHYPLIIVDIPTQRQLRNASANRAQPLLARLSAELGVTYIDLLHYYPRDPFRLYLENDSHWNAEGHRFIAQLLRSVLEGAGVTPSLTNP